LLAKGGTQALDTFLEVVLFLLHVLDGLVALAEETLQAADLGEEARANFEGELC
jgi:hypothetical protein